MGKFDTAAMDRIKTHDGIPGLFAGVAGYKASDKGFTACVFWRGGDDPTHLSASRLNGSGPWLFKDWTTGESVDAIEAVGRLNGSKFRETVIWLGNKFGVQVEAEERKDRPPVVQATLEERLTCLRQLYQKALPLDDGTESAEYFRGRGLLEVARELGVRCYPAGHPAGLLDDATAERFGLKALAWIVAKRKEFAVYPIAVDGKPVLYRSRLLMSDSEAKKAAMISCHCAPKSMHGFKFPALWPALPDVLPEGSEIVLAEGETDAMALRVLVQGIASHAILGTGRFGPDDADFAKLVKARAKVTLAFQNDEASWKSIKRLTDEFQKVGITVTPYVPIDGAKDWAAMLAYGTEPVTTLDAIGAVYGDYAASHMVNATAKYADDLDSGKLKHISLPWPTVQLLMGGMGLPPGTLGLLASRTGVGKSWLSLHMACHAARAGHKTFYLNTELQDSGVGARLLAIMSGVGAVASMSDAAMIRSLVYEHGPEIAKLNLDVTSADLRSLDGVPELLAERIDKGARMLIVDHIGDLDSGDKKTYQALPEFAKEVRKLAHDMGVQIFLVTHLRSGDAEDTLAFSRQIEHVVDYCWALQGYEIRQASCRKDGLTLEQEINRLLVLRKNRYGPSEVKVAMTLDSDTLSVIEHGVFKKWAKSSDGVLDSDWTH